VRLFTLALAALLLVLAVPASAAPLGLADGFREYAGTINGDLRIVMILEKTDTVLTGNYRYDSQRSWLRLKGMMTGDRDFYLNEYDHTQYTGLFKGTFNADGSIEGRWISADYSVSYPFRLEEKAPTPWSGNWTRTDNYFTRAHLEITNVGAGGFDFELNARNGWYFSFIRLTRAQFVGNAAVYQSPQGGNLTFRLQGGGLTIEQQGDLGTALWVFYSGEYRRGKVDLAPPTLTEHGVFAAPATEKAFKDMVGSSYDSFLRCFHLVHEDKDLDQVDATVYIGGVRGLFTIIEGIIMRTPDGEMWAALVVLDKVHYYTNSARFAGLPLTIEHWRSRFPQKPVIIKARP
jgi:hypothetical protein